MMEKKGEMTTQQIVMLIILIASFIVILIFIFLLNFGKTTDAQLCHNSVVQRGSSVVPTDSIPLDCKTSYVCLSEDGSCEKMTKPEVIKVKTKEDVYKTLADNMANCWWMFGEGKSSYVGNDYTHNNYCSICSQVGFDNSVEKIPAFASGVLNKDDFYDYLTVNKPNGNDQTYAEYIFGVDSLEILKKTADAKFGVGGTFGTTDLSKQQYVVMGIVSDVGGWVGTLGVAGAAVGIVAGAVLGGGFGGAIVGALIGGSVGTVGGSVAQSIEYSKNPEILAIIVDGNGVDNKFIAPTIIEAQSDRFKALNCENVITTS